MSSLKNQVRLICIFLSEREEPLLRKALPTEEFDRSSWVVCLSTTLLVGLGQEVRIEVGMTFLFPALSREKERIASTILTQGELSFRISYSINIGYIFACIVKL